MIGVQRPKIESPLASWRRIKTFSFDAHVGHTTRHTFCTLPTESARNCGATGVLADSNGTSSSFLICSNLLQSRHPALHSTPVCETRYSNWSNSTSISEAGAMKDALGLEFHSSGGLGATTRSAIFSDPLYSFRLRGARYGFTL